MNPDIIQQSHTASQYVQSHAFSWIEESGSIIVCLALVLEQKYTITLGDLESRTDWTKLGSSTLPEYYLYCNSMFSNA